MDGFRSSAFLILAVLLAASFAPTAKAVTSVSFESGISETVTIPEGGFHAYSVALSDANTLRVDVRSTMGFLLDVYVLNRTNFLAYVRGSTAFQRIPGPSAESVAILQADFRPTQDGIYYVIVDNGNASPSGAVPVGALSASMALGPALAIVEPSWAALAVAAALGAAFVAALILTYVRPAWHERPWVRKSWTGPAPPPRTAQTAGGFNEFRETPPRP